VSGNRETPPRPADEEEKKPQRLKKSRKG
jgi:hypothetical protein